MTYYLVSTKWKRLPLKIYTLAIVSKILPDTCKFLDTLLWVNGYFRLQDFDNVPNIKNVHFVRDITLGLNDCWHTFNWDDKDDWNQQGYKHYVPHIIYDIVDPIIKQVMRDSRNPGGHWLYKIIIEDYDTLFYKKANIIVWWILCDLAIYLDY